MSSTTQPGLADRFALYRDPHPVRVATFAEESVPVWDLAAEPVPQILLR